MEDTSTTKTSDTLASRKGDPGAVRVGNFINYYQFHPPKDRIEHLPVNISLRKESGKVVCLDIGCNTGDLTQEIFEYVNTNIQGSNDKIKNENDCNILGIDIDPVLISRAEVSNRYRNNVQYETLDIMSDVTMWIHLNHGDEGLKKFLSDLCQMTEILIIEPQPWKCYLTAVRRLKKNNASFPKINELRMNKRVDSNIEDIIKKKHKLKKIYESHPNSWGRRIVYFENTTIWDI